MNDGTQKPVLTFTKAAPTSDQPTIYPTIGIPVWNPQAAATSIIVATKQAKRRRMGAGSNVGALKR